MRDVHRQAEHGGELASGRSFEGGKAPAKRSASRSDDDSASESDEDIDRSERTKPARPR